MPKALSRHVGVPFRGETVHLLRKQWGIRTVKINGKDANPSRWPDGSYSIQGAAAALGITAQTVFKWLRKGRLQGRQLAKGQPWQVILPADQISALANRYDAPDNLNRRHHELLGLERLTGALLDRLTHHVHILEMNGESFRLATSKRTHGRQTRGQTTTTKQTTGGAATTDT